MAFDLGSERVLSDAFVEAVMTEPVEVSDWTADDDCVVDFGGFCERLERAKEAAEKALQRCTTEVEMALDLERAQRRERLETYYEGLKQEQEEEKQSVYFHLYYFEREEKIKKRMERCRREKEAALADDKGLFDVEGEIELASIGLFKVPVHRFRRGRSLWDVEAVSGTLVSDPVR